ncbi:zinc finger, CCHC-type containing protein [Tanacetum coccineum]
MVNSMLSYSGLIVRLPDPKLKTLGERGIECIFVGYAEHSKAFRFFVIEPNESVAINSIIETRDAIFDENIFSSVSRPSQKSLVYGTEDSGGSVVPKKVIDEDHPKTFDEAMKSQDVAFWKEAINNEMDSIMGNNTWVLADLPSVARISTIRLLIPMASIHSLIIYQMDVKTTFLNDELDKEVYMSQPQCFIMTGNEKKVCKLIKSLYGLKHTPKQWHQNFDEKVLSNGYLINQPNKCIYSKFDGSGKGVIICLYVDDILIFGTDQAQVDMTKEFLSSRFSMKDMGEDDVILGIRIKHESNGIAISQSHYIKKYSRVISCLMYAMTCTRHGIALAEGKLSRLMYTGYPLGLEGYTDASWISNTEDNSSTSGWVFLLSGGAISWASKKQTCITSSTMKSEFVGLAAASKEAEWLKNLLFEIPLWVKPIAPISIRCDSTATLAKAYKFVRSQQNLADHLTKGLARDLAIKSAKGIGLKNCTKLGRILGNLVQLRVQFIPNNGARVYSSVGRNSELKDIHQFNGFSMDEELDAVTHCAIALVEHLNQMNGLNKDGGNILLGELQIAFLLAQFVSDHFGGRDESLMVERARKSAFRSTNISAKKIEFLRGHCYSEYVWKISTCGKSEEKLSCCAYWESTIWCL